VTDSTPDWSARERPPAGAPNILIMMLDDVGFADFGCYGSEIDTPNIDALAARGIRFTGFHTTAMCSTTRASLHTGRNHHAVGMGCLSNFDSGYPGYRGKLDPAAPTLAETLAGHGYRNYYVGKWHVAPLTQSGPTGPFDGWPLGRGFDRFFGFLDAETDQYSPELVRDNSHVSAEGNFETGYHLTEDLFREAQSMIKGHIVGVPDEPWMMMVMPGACHAPHQAPAELIAKYDARFAKGWDQTRTDRLARQIATGIVPDGTELPDRNHMVGAWHEHTPDEQRLFTRLAAAYGAMLEHADTHFGQLLDFLAAAGQLDNTLVLALSDNGASQEGGPQGFVNAMGPFNMVAEDMADKIARIDDIGGPDTHSNFPWGWAMAANTPLKRYKQNTHGGGVRDPLVIAGPGLEPGDGLRHQFSHVSDLMPTVLDLIGVQATGVIDGTSFAESIRRASAGDPTGPDHNHDDAHHAGAEGKTTQYFEMFGHRGLWHEGWKAVAYHPPGKSFDDDQWELYNLAEDFNERHDLAREHPEKLAELIDRWWTEAEANQVLPLDDRFAERFAENAERHRGDRTNYVFWNGVGHVPSEVAPDLRSRSYTITAEIVNDGAGGSNGAHDSGGKSADGASGDTAGADGVLVAHGDATSGYSLFVRHGYLVHDLNIGGHHHVVTSDRPVSASPGTHTLGFRMVRESGGSPIPRGVGTLFIDGEAVGSLATDKVFWLMISWSGLDIGFDRGTTVSDYDGTGRHMGPFPFTGARLIKVTVEVDTDQTIDHQAAGHTELARE